MTFVSNSWSFLFDFGRPITLLSPKNIPGTHQYAVSHCGANCGADFGVLFKKNLVGKVSCYMRFFLILPNKYYTFVTSPCLSASPSPAPVCSICGGPNRLDLWLNLWRKLWRRFWGCFWSHFWSTKCRGIWSFFLFYLIDTILSWHPLFSP